MLCVCVFWNVLSSMFSIASNQTDIQPTTLYVLAHIDRRKIFLRRLYYVVHKTSRAAHYISSLFCSRINIPSLGDCKSICFGSFSLMVYYEKGKNTQPWSLVLSLSTSTCCRVQGHNTLQFKYQPIHILCYFKSELWAFLTKMTL